MLPLWTCRSWWLCSCQCSCRLACSTHCYSLCSGAPHDSASSNRSLFSAQLLLSCQVHANQWVFLPFSFMSVLLITYSGNGQVWEELLFSLAHSDHLSKEWNRLEPRSVCYSAGKGASRTLASLVAPASLCAVALCGGPTKVAVRGFFWSLVFSPNHLVDAVTEWQKMFFFPYPWPCCLL